MDKSEGTDVISKFFGSISDGLSKLYLKGQQRLTRASLKRMRSEKIVELGTKLFKLLDTSSPVSAVLFKEEYEAIVRIDNDLREYDINEAGKPGAEATPAPKGRRGGRRKQAAGSEEAAPAPKGKRGGRRKQTAGSEEAVPAPKGRRGGRRKQTAGSEEATPAPKGRRGGRRKAESSAAALPVVITAENEQSEAIPTETTDSKE